MVLPEGKYATTGHITLRGPIWGEATTSGFAAKVLLKETAVALQPLEGIGKEGCTRLC